MPLIATVTNAGRAALVNAANTGTAPVTIAQVGVSGTAVAADPAATVLTGESKRIATLSGDVVADDTIHLIVRDESADVFTVRSFALYLADGTLFALYGQAGAILEKSAQAMMLLAIDVTFEDIDASSITFSDANFLNPPATTEQIGVVELATLAETIAGLDTSRVPAAKMVKDAVFSWLDSRFGAGNSGIWHPGNDGAGSGLDADLLDGQQGSYYSNIPDRLGFTPLNKAGDTATGRVSFAGGSTGNNGMAAAPLGRGEVEARGNGTGAAMIALHRPDSFGAYFGLDTDNRLKIGGWSFGAVAYEIWHSGNDGAGSGMDADLLDGQDGSYYSNITARLGYTPLNKAGDTMTGPLTIGGGAGSGLALSSVHTAEKQISFQRAGGTAYLYGNASAIGLQDTVYGSIWSWTYGGSFAIQGSQAWTAGNDGAGSGMDADLLDGQQGSYYSNITARLGYTPLNKAGDTATGRMIFAAGATANSGMAAAPAATAGELEVRGNGVGGAFAAFHRPGAYAAYFGLDTDNIWKVGGWSAGAVAHTLWHSGNDGSGSGLDADLLDGFQHSDFAKMADFANSLGTPGVQRLPNGLILQWGNVVAPSGGINTVTFPLAFPNACLAGFASNQTGAVPSAWAGAGNISQTGMTVGHAASALNPAAAGTAAFWFAIGR